MGVKSPLTGRDSGVAEGITRGVPEGVAVGLIVGVGVGLDGGVGLGVADGEATKAGTSPACTTKFLVKVLVIPDASSQEIVMEWGPSESGTEGL